MYTIDETINELDELDKIVNKVPFTKNRNKSISSKLTRNRSQIYLSKEHINNKKIQRNRLYNFSLSYKDGCVTKTYNMNDSTGTDTTQDNFNLNFNFFRPGNLLFEIFINISEFDENKFDFYVSYTNLCGLLKEVNIIDKKLYTNVIITQYDLDLILKKIKKSNNSSKKFNFKEYVKFFSYLVYKIDYWHFIDKPKRTLNFNINKFFGEYFKVNKMSFINLIYNYVLYVQQETNINALLYPIISNIKNIFIQFIQKKNENINLLNEIDNNNSFILKRKFKNIMNIMKFLGIFPNLINIKELVVIYYIQLDDSNDNDNLNIEEFEVDTDSEISFKKFCQLFLCLCLYIKNKKHTLLTQFSYLLKEENKDINFLNELKFGLKEGIIRYILNLKSKKLSQDNKSLNYNHSPKNKTKIIKEKFHNEIEKLKIKDLDFLLKIFESFSSHHDKYLNYQISFSDIITFLKENKFLKDNQNNKNTNLHLLIEDKYFKAKNRINNNISSLKSSLHSLDKFIKGKKDYNNTNIYNNTNKKSISLRNVEIFYCKVSKRADINNRLSFIEFLKFLYLCLDKLGFKYISELIKYLYLNRKTNMEIFKKQKDELRQLKLLYHELKSNEIFNIIQQISPIINIYFISFANKINKYTLTFDLFLKIFTEFDLYPNIIGYNVLIYLKLFFIY